jgi:hypothetical protein
MYRKRIDLSAPLPIHSNLVNQQRCWFTYCGEPKFECWWTSCVKKKVMASLLAWAVLRNSLVNSVLTCILHIKTYYILIFNLAGAGLLPFVQFCYYLWLLSLLYAVDINIVRENKALYDCLYCLVHDKMWFIWHQDQYQYTRVKTQSCRAGLLETVSQFLYIHAEISRGLRAVACSLYRK